MRKKTFFILTLQVVVIGVFVLIAVGSASQSSATSSYKEDIRAGMKAGAIGAAAADYVSKGYKFIGVYDSSDCPKQCANAGYTKYAYADTYCYCK